MIKRNLTLVKRLLTTVLALSMLAAAVPISAEGETVSVSVRSGAELNEVELLDTLVAAVNGGTAAAYRWQVSTDSGATWTDIEGETNAEYIVSAAQAGAQVRCAVTADGSEICSDAVQIPNYTAGGAGPSESAPEGSADNSPAAYKFTVDGKGFVLLDIFDNDESTYYVTTTDAYGDLRNESDGNAVSGAEINYDAYATDAFLNGDFLTIGNNFSNKATDDTATYYKLPQGIIDNINTNHVWWRYVNDYRKGTGVQSTYKTGVSFLSADDFATYKGVLGTRDNVLKSEYNRSNSDGASALLYPLRDTNAWGGDNAVLAFGDSSANIVTNGFVYTNSYNMPALLLRPAFYLKKSFFKTAHINLASTGSAVIDELKSVCTKEELLDLYSVQECKDYLGMDIDIDYISLSLRSGKDMSDVELLDTVTASTASGNIDEFCWKISDDGGSSWSVVDGAVGNSFILSAEYAGKTLCCTAESNGIEIKSSAISIPNFEVITPDNVTFVPEASAEKTPDMYRFTVEGKEFVLLDTFDNDESSFYVTTVNQYGDLNVLSENYENATDKDMTYDSYVSVKNFLNEEFLTDGNNLSVIGADTRTYYKLPDEIIENINFNHIWYRYVAPLFIEDGSPVTYKAGVSLLSWTDFTKYAGKFGVGDVFDDDNLNGAVAYFLRDTNNWGDYKSIAVIKNTAPEQYIFNNIQPNNAEAALVRPAFYLKNDFFKTVKLDLSETGEAVLDMMRERYYIEDLADVYSEQELRDFGFMGRYSMQTTYTQYNDTTELTSLEGISSLQANVKIRNRGAQDTDAVLLMAVYNESGKLIKELAKQPVVLKARSDTDSTVAVTSLPGGITSGYKVSLMLWDSVKEMCVLARKLTFGNRGDINGDTADAEFVEAGNVAADSVTPSKEATVEYDVENGVMTVCGNVGTAMQAVSMEVLAGGVTAEQFEAADAEQRYDMIAYADETLSSENGSWQFDFEFPADTLKHVIRIRTGLKGNVEAYGKIASKVDDCNEALSKINSADYDNISDLLKNSENAFGCADILGLDGETFTNLPEKNRNAMGRRILNRRNAQPNMKYTKASLTEVFNEELALECVNAADESNIESVLEKYGAYFDYKNQSGYEIFTGLSSDNRTKVYANLSKNDYDSSEEFDAEFGIEAVRVKLAALRGYDELYDVIPQIAGVLEADISTYKKLSKENQRRVCSDIIDELSSKSVTKELFEQIVNGAAGKYSSGGSSGNTGNKGGGSSSGRGQTTTSVEFAASNDPVNNESMFDDLDSVRWAAESIEELAKRGVINGKGEKTFAPNDFVTREEFVKMVVLAMGLPIESADCDFNDVGADAWYRNYICSAVSCGIVNGMGDGNFGVGMNVSRQDIAKILWNCIKESKPAGTAQAFDDLEEISDYAKEAVNAMRYLKIIDGYDDNTFRPQSAATRAEAAKLLYKVIQITE